MPGRKHVGIHRLQLIGSFALRARDERVLRISSAKCRAMLAYLALAPGGVRSRQTLAECLWPSERYEDNKANLRRELSSLRRMLKSGGAEDLLMCDNSSVMLALDRVEVDVLELESGGKARTGAYDEFLEGIDTRDSEPFEEWLRNWRQRVDELIDEARTRAAAPQEEPRTVSDATGIVKRAGPPETSHEAPPKPSVTITPFEVMAQTLQPWWGNSLFEGISAALSTFPQLLVGSSNSARTLSRSTDDPRLLAARLGVAYVVTGALFPTTIGIRIIVKLIKGESGEQVWTGTFRAECDDEGPDERIALGIAHALWTAIDVAERNNFVRLSRPPQSNYERYWVANALYRTWNAPDIARAAIIAKELSQRDPACPWANSLAGFCNAWAWLFQALPDREALREEAIGLVAQARRNGPDNVETLGYCAATLTILDADLDHAGSLIDHALHVLPDHQPALFWGAWNDLTRKNPERALHRFKRSLQVNPSSWVKPIAQCGMGAALMMQSRPEEALALFSEARIADPGSPLVEIGVQLAQTMASTSSAPSSLPNTWTEIVPLLSNHLAAQSA